MTDYQYAKEMIEALYEEADRDIIFFGQIIGAVSYDKEDKILNKTPEKRLEDALKLADYLISKDFISGKTIKYKNNNIFYEIYKDGFRELSMDVNNIYLKNGIEDIDLNVRTWLKKNRNARCDFNIPYEILDLFE